MNVPFQYSDGGRVAAGATFKGESSDCCVRALSNVLGISYHEAHTRVSAAGRKTGHRWAWKAFRLFMAEQGFKELPGYSLGARVQLRKALPALSKGRFICCVTGHVFAVVDGVVLDTWVQTPGRQIFSVYTKL